MTAAGAGCGSGPVAGSGAPALAPALDRFVDLVWSWNRSINLVSARDAADLRRRHVADCLQLLDLVPVDPALWVDAGSGAGFPGLVVALGLRERGRDGRVVLVEADRRKSAFLTEAVRQLDLRGRVEVMPTRVETLPPLGADVVSARALAPLAELLAMLHRQFGSDTLGVFPKGRRSEQEVRDARARWTFEADLRQSRTDPEARIVLVRGVRDGG